MEKILRNAVGIGANLRFRSYNLPKAVWRRKNGCARSMVMYIVKLLFIRYSYTILLSFGGYGLWYKMIGLKYFHLFV